MYYQDCYSGPFHALGGIIEAILWIAFILIVLRLWKYFKNSGSVNWRSWRGDRAEELLKERFVKGEVTPEEYEEKMRVIRSDVRPDNRPKGSTDAPTDKKS